MAYPRKLLNDGEDIVLDLHPHWRIFLAPVGLVVLGTVAAIVAAVLLNNPPATVATGVLLAGAVVWFAGRWVVWRTTHFVLTTRRVISRRGVFSKQGLNIPLERINNVASSQRPVERLLGVGDLIIESAGASGRQVFRDVRDPAAVENRISLEIEREQARDDTRAARAGISVADELAKLEDLRARGVLSAEEFEAQKARLLQS